MARSSGSSSCQFSLLTCTAQHVGSHDQDLWLIIHDFRLPRCVAMHNDGPGPTSNMRSGPGNHSQEFKEALAGSAESSFVEACRGPLSRGFFLVCDDIQEHEPHLIMTQH